MCVRDWVDGLGGSFGFWRGFEHIGPFAGPRLALPSTYGNGQTYVYPTHNTGKLLGWGKVGLDLWRLSCQAVGLPVEQGREGEQGEEEYDAKDKDQ